MKNEKRRIDCKLHTWNHPRLQYVIKYENIEYAYVYQTITACLSDIDRDVHVRFDLEIVWNQYEKPTKKIANEVEWMFNNLVNTIGWDLRNLVDEHICDRLNNLWNLIKCKIERKEE